MSRNYTPLEMHREDMWAYKNRGEYIHDTRIIFTEANGDKVDVGCKRFPELYAKFPTICFLWNTKIVKKLHDAGMEEMLSKIEAKVSELAKADDEGKLTFNYDYNSSKFNDVVQKWFFGKLDEGFRYCERNNELLMDYCYFWKFTEEYKVGDTFYYTLDEFDMVRPKTIECKIREITDSYILYETADCDHEMIDFDMVKDFEFRKVA